MLGRMKRYVVRVSIFLITAALIAGMVGCDLFAPPSQNLEIRTWYDLDAVRDNLGGDHILMNDLDSTTAGYEELASPTANNGTGWEPIGWGGWTSYWMHGDFFTGSFDGQGYEIRDLFSSGNGWGGGGLFGCVGKRGIIKNVGVIKAITTLPQDLGAFVALNQRIVAFAAPIIASGILVGFNNGSVSDSYTSGVVSGESNVGGLVGTNIGTVSNCYSTANVTGGTWGVGGLVGSNGVLKYGGRVTNCYSKGSVTGYDEHVGGLVGMNEGSGAGQNFRGTVRTSFWDTQTSGQATSAGGVGKTTAQMKSVATFTGAGWNITAVANPGTRNPSYIWNIVNGVTYPFLSWET